MRHIIHRSRLALLALTGVLALVACDLGPSEPGVAAVVGDTHISVDSLQREFRWLLDNVQATDQLKQQNQLGRISTHSLSVRVQHELIASTAARLGVKPDPAEVERVLKNLGGADEAAPNLLTTPDRVRQRIEDVLLLREIGRHYVDRLSVRVTGALLTREEPGKTSRQRAIELGEAMAEDPRRAAELAAMGDHQLPSELVLAEVVAGENALLAQTPLFAVEPGTVVVMQPNRQQGALWLVALVEERSETDGAGGGEFPDEALEQIGVQMLRPAADRLGVTISPRYGVWDEASMAILDSEDQAQSQLFTANGVDRQ